MMRVLATLLLILPSCPDEWSDFQTLAKDRDPEKRCQAVERIKAHADLRMVQALLPLLADEHPRVRKRAAAAIAPADSPDCRRLLRQIGLRHSSPTVRLHCASILGRFGTADDVPALTGSLGDPDPEVRAAAASGLATLNPGGTAEKLERATRDPAWQVRAALLEARPDSTVAAKAMGDPAYQVRMTAALVAPGLGTEDGTRLLERACADPDWRVRVQAIESAMKLRTPGVVGPLIEMLAREKGRLRWDLHLALRDLTRKDLGLQAGPWRSWWSANREGFVVPAAGEPGGDVPASGGETAVSFFRIPILSTRIAFVLDLSGSMRDPAPPGTPDAGSTKLDIAKRETNRTLQRLTEETAINIVGLGCEGDGRYPKDQKRWQKQVVPATARHRAEAASYVARQEAKGWTNIWDGITLAMEDDAVDTIYLYTDGGASRGIFVKTDEILEEFAAANKYRKLMIHTIEVPGEKPNSADNLRLIRSLAEITRGTAKLAR